MTHQTGFIKLIILIVVLLVILGYFGINVRSVIENKTAQSNVGYVWNWCKAMWGTYLASPAKYLWNDVFIKLLWNSFIESMQKIKAGQNPKMIENGPTALPQ
jgi:ABC-type Fe3+ transport system permease subunit